MSITITQKEGGSGKLDELLSHINTLMADYIDKEIKQYESLGKSAQRKYNLVTFFAIAATASIPVISYTGSSLATSIVGASAAILSTMSFSFNFRYEWQTHLVSLVYHKGKRSAFLLAKEKILLSNGAEEGKVLELIRITEEYLGDFNRYEYAEIVSYFKQIKDITNVNKTGK